MADRPTMPIDIANPATIEWLAKNTSTDWLLDFICELARTRGNTYRTDDPAAKSWGAPPPSWDTQANAELRVWEDLARDASMAKGKLIAAKRIGGT